MTTEQYRTRSGLSIFLSFFRPHRGLFFLDLACALVVALIDLAYPIVSRYAMRTLLPQNAYRAFFTVMLVVVAAYGLRALSAGDDVVLPVSEHHSSLIPWQTVADLTGANLVYVLPDEQGRFNEEAWERAIGPRTKIVAVAHVSNVLGNVAPLDRIARMAHGAGAVVVADCAQSVAHLPVDVRALDVDFAAFSGHKVYAPMGIGVLYGKRALLEEMPPFLTGGEMIESVTREGAVFAELPHKFEAGTVNAAGAAGLRAAIEYVESVGFDAMHRQELALTQRTLAGMADMPHIHVIGSDRAEEHNGIITFTVEGVHPHDVSEILACDGVDVRAGHHCAQPLLQHLGYSATVRASFAFYNTENEVDRLLQSLSTIRERMGYGN